ncbi:MAG: hypothetical protein KDI13_05720 [Alphaproteobacteria bacterium]|nr:hypothetical protein [Alphaproteobacteria bacterium]
MTDTAPAIENTSWRDQTYREIAKTYAAEGKTDEAIAIIEKIETPDTKAMTIRGIGMAAAKLNLPAESRTALWTTLRAQAEKITHPPSYAIALTYIAMSQAFAGDNQAAWDTAADMENDALRHKAYGETAEIQAENHDPENAFISISKIDSASYRDKSAETVSRLFSDAGDYNNAYKTAQMVTNPYKKTLALQYMLAKQSEEETKEDPKP